MNDKYSLPSSAETERQIDGPAPEHDNGFGMFRLIFAALVIVSHTSEIHDGNRSRELLTLTFNTLSFGELAVDGFFVISGYLIAASFLNSKSAIDYIARRVARIYPGFLMSYVFCALVVAPLGAVVWITKSTQIASAVVGAFMLRPPDVGAVFPGQPYPDLNGASWTIAFEFQCYVVVSILGVTGVLRMRWPVTLLAILVTALAIHRFQSYSFYTAHAYEPFDLFTKTGVKNALTGVFKPSWRLMAIFLTGACFRLYSDRLSFRWVYVASVFVILVVGLRVGIIADTSFAIAGGYLIFFLAQSATGTVFARINNRHDVSYGLYLYGWPVEKLIYYYWPAIGLWQAGATTLIIAYSLGWVSWLGIERPATKVVRNWIKNKA